MKAASGKVDQLNWTPADLAGLQAPEGKTSFQVNDSRWRSWGGLLVHNHGHAGLPDELRIWPAGILGGRRARRDKLSIWRAGTAPPASTLTVSAWQSAHQKTCAFRCLAVSSQSLLERATLPVIANSPDNDGRIQRFQVMVIPQRCSWNGARPLPGSAGAA